MRTNQKNERIGNAALDRFCYPNIAMDARGACIYHHQPWLKVIDDVQHISQALARRWSVHQTDVKPIPLQGPGRIGQPDRVIHHSALDHSRAALRAGITRMEWGIQGQYIHSYPDVDPGHGRTCILLGSPRAGQIIL